MTKLVGKDVMIVCRRFIYSGRLLSHHSGRFELGECQVAFDTSAVSDSGNSVYIMESAVEMVTEIEE